jgi:hypothetical protein
LEVCVVVFVTHVVPFFEKSHFLILVASQHSIRLLVIVGGINGTVVLMKATTVIFLKLLGFSDGIELGLRLGAREGWRLGVPLGLSDGIELGLRLGTREGVRLGLPLDLSDEIELGLRLSTSINFTHRTHIIYRPVTIQCLRGGRVQGRTTVCDRVTMEPPIMIVLLSGMERTQQSWASSKGQM